MLYVLGMILISSVVTILSAPFSVKMTGELKHQRSLKDEKVEYKLTIKNRGIFFYPIVEYDFSNSEFTKSNNPSGTFNIRPFHTDERTYTIQIPYSGCYPVGLDKVVVSDLLGLFKRTLDIEISQPLIVYPKSDDAFAVRLREDAESSPIDIKSYTESYEDVIDVRQYVPADSLKHIHWKLSAKKNELLVKNYPSMASRVTTLYADTRKIPINDYIQRLAFQDGILSRITAAVYYCSENQQHAELMYDDNSIEIKSADDLSSAYEYIAKIPFDKDYSDIVKLANSLNEGVIPMVYMIFTAYIDAEVEESIKRMMVFDHTIFLYYFYTGEITDEQKKLFERIQIMGVTINKIKIGLPKLKS